MFLEVVGAWTLSVRAMRFMLRPHFEAMRTMSQLSIRPLCALAVLLLVACSQGEGEACQRNSDCDDGLICDITLDGRGTCQDPDRPGGGEMPDAAVDAAEPPLPDEDAGGLEPEPEPDEDAGR
jgi:hypothetical protein